MAPCLSPSLAAPFGDGRHASEGGWRWYDWTIACLQGRYMTSPPPIGPSCPWTPGPSGERNISISMVFAMTMLDCKSIRLKGKVPVSKLGECLSSASAKTEGHDSWSPWSAHTTNNNITSQWPTWQLRLPFPLWHILFSRGKQPVQVLYPWSGVLWQHCPYAFARCVCEQNEGNCRLDFWSTGSVDSDIPVCRSWEAAKVSDVHWITLVVPSVTELLRELLNW